VKPADEVALLFGLLSGLNAVLHDRRGTGAGQVPVDVVPRVGRVALCLESERWFFGPQSLQAAAWVTIPGSAPVGTDPWVALAEAAANGEPSGVRLARALEVYLAYNAGRTDHAKRAIVAHAASLASVPMSEEWALLDTYATSVSTQISDLIWIEETGHRTPVFGQLPTVTVPEAPDDLFGDDPFNDLIIDPDVHPQENPP